MNQHVFSIGSITHAIKARDLLNRAGIKAILERASSEFDIDSCGYHLIFQQDPETASALLQAAKINFIYKPGGMK